MRQNTSRTETENTIQQVTKMYEVHVRPCWYTQHIQKPSKAFHFLEFTTHDSGSTKKLKCVEGETDQPTA